MVLIFIIYIFHPPFLSEIVENIYLILHINLGNYLWWYLFNVWTAIRGSIFHTFVLKDYTFYWDVGMWSSSYTYVLKNYHFIRNSMCPLCRPTALSPQSDTTSAAITNQVFCFLYDMMFVTYFRYYLTKKIHFNLLCSLIICKRFPWRCLLWNPNHKILRHMLRSQTRVQMV